MDCDEHTLTDRQKREIEYHRIRAQQYNSLIDEPVSYDVLFSNRRRWWNAYWRMYDILLAQQLKSKKCLIVGCGFGDDALRVAKLGGDVYAFDLSKESLEIARQLAHREQLQLRLKELAAERLAYSSNFFDVVIARDILHHTDIPVAMDELCRVAKDGALVIINEIYSHSFTHKVRYSNVVESYLYPLMKEFVYRGAPYITEDERKLNEVDIARIVNRLGHVDLTEYFDFIVNRILPGNIPLFNRIDRLLLLSLRPFASLLSGRILITGRMSK